MKVLINIPDLEMSGGVSSYYKTIKPYFASKVTFFTIGRRKKSNHVLGYLWQIIKDYYNFFVLINAINYDVTHINPSLGSKSFIRDALFVAMAKLSKKRVIVFFHGWDEGFEAFSEKYLLWLYKITYFRADAIIVLAEQFKTKLEDIGYKGEIYVETTVVDDNVFDDFNIIDKNYKNKNINLLFLSRLENEKGIYELIDALKILNKKYTNIVLTVAGDGSEMDSLMRYAKKCNVDNVGFTGFITGSDKDMVFKQADIFILPSYSEGMPLAVLEAMAYGLPVVTTPVGGLRDFFKNGRMGFFIDAGKARDISIFIDKIISNHELRVKMSHYNSIYAEEHFKASRVVSRLESIYRQS